MSTKIFLEALTEVNPSDSTVKVTLESYIALFVYRHLGASANELNIILVRSERPVDDTTISVDVAELQHIYQTVEQYQSEIANLCNFPVLVTDQSVVIAGLCGVCRGMIKFAQNKQLESLLGFKGACLLAPSEMSVWTKFCEIDFIECTKTVLNVCSAGEFNGSKDNDKQVDCLLPEAFGRFESHMGQPLRMHNVYKFARNMAKENLRKETAKEDAEDAANLLESLSIVDEIITNDVRDKIPRRNKSKKKKVKIL